MPHKNLIIILFVLLSKFCDAQNKADDIVGYWLTAGSDPAKIQIYKQGEKYYGKIAWLKFPNINGAPKTDVHNADKAKRGNPIVGIIILKGFTFNGSDEWKGGEIYDPQNGKSYSSFLSLKNNNTLKLRGYVGISLFGRTEIWSRATQ